MDSALREHLQRMAAENPEMRRHLVPLLRSSRTTKTAQGPVVLDDPDVMLFVIDQEDNKSKFYEMAYVISAVAPPAQKTKDFSRGAPAPWVLLKRWGRLTDSGTTGRVDSLNEVYATKDEAQRAMMAWKQKKIHESGYQDVSRTRKYPIGLGAAGFGWGGQAACAFVPELRGLHGQVGELLRTLMGMQRTVKTLQDQRSGLADDLAGHVLALTDAAGGMSEYLNDQLAHCR